MGLWGSFKRVGGGLVDYVQDNPIKVGAAAGITLLSGGTAAPVAAGLLAGAEGAEYVGGKAKEALIPNAKDLPRRDPAKEAADLRAQGIDLGKPAYLPEYQGDVKLQQLSGGPQTVGLPDPRAYSIDPSSIRLRDPEGKLQREADAISSRWSPSSTDAMLATERQSARELGDTFYSGQESKIRLATERGGYDLLGESAIRGDINSSTYANRAAALEVQGQGLLQDAKVQAKQMETQQFNDAFNRVMMMKTTDFSRLGQLEGMIGQDITALNNVVMANANLGVQYQDRVAQIQQFNAGQRQSYDTANVGIANQGLVLNTGRRDLAETNKATTLNTYQQYENNFYTEAIKQNYSADLSIALAELAARGQITGAVLSSLLNSGLFFAARA